MNNQNPPKPDGSFGPEFMEKFQGTIKSYAEAIAHPTPDLLVAEAAANSLRAGDWVAAEEACRKHLTMQEQTGNPGLLAKPRMDLSRLFCLIR
jgi:hypothetical protein